MAVIDPGDEVVIPAPYWVSYPDIVLLADGVPVMPYCRPRAGLQDHARAARGGDHAADAALHPQQPEQPDGRGLHARRARRARRGAAAPPARARSARTTCTSTSTGAPEPFCSLLTAVPALYDRTVTVNGVSKSYAMTGWRIGYCGGPGGDRRGDGDDPEPEHVEPELDRAEGGHGRADRRPGVRGRDERPLQGAARFLQRRAQRAARVQGAAGGGNVLRVVRRLATRSAGWACRTTTPSPSSCSRRRAWRACRAPVSARPGHIRFSFATSLQMLAQALERIGRALG